jgi:hypothetical protein
MSTQSNPTPRKSAKAAKGTKTGAGAIPKDEEKISPEANASSGNGHANGFGGFANAKAEAYAREEEAREKKTEDELWGTDRKFLVELNPESVANRLHGRVIKDSSGFDISFPDPFAGQNEEDYDDDDGGNAYGPPARKCVLSYSPGRPYGFDLYTPPGANFKRIRQLIIDKLLLKETSKLRGKERKTLEDKTAEYVSARKREQRAYFDDMKALYWDRAKAITSDDPAGKYLNVTRGAPLPEIDDALRYLPGTRVTEGRHKGILTDPAYMIGMAFDQETDEERLFHFTIIDSNGRNTDFKCGRYTVKRRHTKCGNLGYIPLRKGSYKMLAVGEGLETTLSAFKIPELDGMAVWSLLSARGMAKLPVRPEFDGIVLVQDWEPPDPKSGETIGPGQLAAEECAQRWLKAGKTVQILKPIKPDGVDKWDLNDVINAKGFAPGVGYVVEDFTGLPPDKLDFIHANGKFVLNDTNVKILIARCKEVARLLSYNEFYDGVMITGPLPGKKPHGRYPRPVDDDDCLALLEFVQQTGRFEKAKKELVCTGMEMFARDNRVHPLREYLRGLKWDGTPRIDMALHDYLGVRDDAGSRLISKIFFLSMIHLAMDDICKVDESLTLIGTEAMFKSTFLRILASDEYFSDCLPSLAGNAQMKEAQEHLQAYWLVELQEGASIKNAEAEKIKLFLSIQEDAYRTPYGHRTAKHPRHTGIAISTNDHEFFRDRTGNRRFLPVVVAEAFAPTGEHMDKLREDRDQLWAEAYHRAMVLNEIYYSTHEEDEKLLRPLQEKHRAIEAWEEQFLDDIREALEREDVLIWADDLRVYFMDMKTRFGRLVPKGEYLTVLRKKGWTNEKRRRIKVWDKRKGKVVSSANPDAYCWSFAGYEGKSIERVLAYVKGKLDEPGMWDRAKTWFRPTPPEAGGDKPGTNYDAEPSVWDAPDEPDEDET